MGLDILVQQNPGVIITLISSRSDVHQDEWPILSIEPFPDLSKLEKKCMG